MTGPRVAFVHDWLVRMRGGERCLDALLAEYPDAEVFTLFADPEALSPRLRAARIHESPLARVHGIGRHHRWFLPLFPWAVGTFDLAGFDRVVSLSHCVAIGARAPAGTMHLAYVFTPMRYLADQRRLYLGPVARIATAPVASSLARWERAAVTRPGRIVAISGFVADRIGRTWGRQAQVVYPPVDCDRFEAAAAAARPDCERPFVCVSALVPYKRVVDAVLAFNRLGLPLVIAGTGPDEARLRRLAGPNVRMLGWVGDDEVARLVGSAEALIHPGEEEFGIAPVEAQAAGTPVIALGLGGAAETVTPATGVLYDEPGPDALADAVLAFRRRAGEFDPAALRVNARRFDTPRFIEAMRTEIEAG